MREGLVGQAGLDAVDRDAGGVAPRERLEPSVGGSAEADGAVAGIGHATAIHAEVGEFEPLARRRHAGEIGLVFRCVAGKPAGPVFEHVAQVRRDRDRAVGKAAGQVGPGAGEMFRLVVVVREGVGGRVGPEGPQHVEPRSDILPQARRLIIARPHAQGERLAATGVRAVHAHHVVQEPRRHGALRPRHERVRAVHEEMREHGLRRDVSKHALEGNRFSGHDEATIDPGVEVGPHEILPRASGIAPLPGAHGRWPRPHHPPALRDEFPHHRQEPFAGKRLEERSQRGELPPGEVDRPVAHFAECRELLLRDQVGVAVLRHPTAKPLLAGDEVQRVEHQHVDVAVLHVLHEAMHGGAAHAVGVGHCLASAVEFPGHAPVRGVGVGQFVDDPEAAGERKAVVVAIEPASLGVVVAVAREVVAPFEIVGAGGGGLLHRVRPDEVRRVFVVVPLGGLAKCVPAVDGGALRPGGMGPGLEPVPDAGLRVVLRFREQIDHGVLQQPVVAGAEERRVGHGLRRFPPHVSRAGRRPQIADEVFLAVGEIDEPLREVAILLAVELREACAKRGRHVAHRELAVVVVGEVMPVLLDVHLVAVETVQFHPGVDVAIDETRQEGQRLRAEIVELRRAVLLHHQHAVEPRKVGPAAAVHPHPHGLERAGFVDEPFEHLGLRRLGDLDDLTWIDDLVRGATQLALAEGEDADPGILERDRPLVIGPPALPPQGHAVGAARRVTEALAVVHPLPRLARGRAKAGADLQGAQEAQFKADPILRGEAADRADALDGGVGVGQVGPGRGLGRLAIFAEEVVVGEDHCAESRGLRALAELPKRLHAGLARQAEIHRLVRIGEIVELLVVDEHEVGLAQLERPRAGVGDEFAGVAELGHRRGLRDDRGGSEHECHQLAKHCG